LASSSLEVVGACLGALAKLPRGTAASEQLALLGAVRRLGTAATEHGLRSRAVALLRRNTGRRFGFVSGKKGRVAQPKAVAAWTAFLETAYPKETRRLLGAAAASLEGLKKRLARVDWDNGDVSRGKRVFAKRGCVQCHQGRRALGPDLAGSAGRFSRADLFTAIVLPNRDVSPRYQTTVVQTDDGRVYNGLIVYQSVDGLTLRTGTNQTIRLEREEIEYQARRPESLMSSGLLKGLDDGGYADLYAYLKTLRK
jgi:putative heme-binding domain-containing protein